MLSERAQILLKTLIERYIADGQPIGSRTLLHHARLNLSSASIRSILSDLQEIGLLESPHHSAGRIPTTEGFRLFTERLMSTQTLHPRQIQHLASRLQDSNPTRLVNEASHLLAELTHFAGVVKIPKQRHAAFSRLEFILLSSQRILLVIISIDGGVQNRILSTDRPYDNETLGKAAHWLNEHCAGLTFEAAQQVLQHELQSLHQDIDTLMRHAMQAVTLPVDDSTEDWVLSGEHQLLNNAHFSSLKKLHDLFAMFEQKTSLLQLLNASENAQGVQIFIGSKANHALPEDCSIVSAPYYLHGQPVGTLGIIGPIRMPYDRIVPVVDMTAKLLSNALSHY